MTPLLTLALAALDVGGASECPTPARVQELLGWSSEPLGFGAWVELRPLPDGVEVMLWSAEHRLRDRRVLERTGTCDELAREVATLVAAWAEQPATEPEPPAKVELEAAPPDGSGGAERRLHFAVGGGGRVGLPWIAATGAVDVTYVGEGMLGGLFALSVTGPVKLLFDEPRPEPLATRPLRVFFTAGAGPLIRLAGPTVAAEIFSVFSVGFLLVDVPAPPKAYVMFDADFGLRLLLRRRGFVPFIRFAGGIAAWTFGTAAAQPNASFGVGLMWSR